MKLDIEEKKKIVEDLVLKFANVDTKFRKKNQDKVDHGEASEIIFDALINFIGNFIYHNSKKNRNARIFNYKRFIDSFDKWIYQFEAHAKKN